MAYTVIDGDISYFFDLSTNLSKKFRTDRLRGYLLAAGHTEDDVAHALAQWQETRFSLSTEGEWRFGLLQPERPR